MNGCVCEKKDPAEARRLDLPEVVPATDVYERDDAYLIVADVPGVEQKDLEISVEERVLAIEGLADLPEPAQATLLHREFGPVRYRRTFQLSDDIDVEKIGAAVKNGVLRVTLPKAAARQPRKITVAAG